MGYLWDNFTNGVFDYAMSAYASLEPWVYPLLFMGIIGYVYAVMNSLVVTIVAIILTLGIYAGTTDVFAAVPDVTLFLYIVTIIGLVLLIGTLFWKRRS